ncbi:MAG TPA: DNA-binding protein [Verrucomicrobiae bacterium]|nr:DNA-binding protein [Verrucomicrobiae bacterium]
MKVCTFGGLTVYCGRSPFAINWESQKARLLFCYLLITYDQWVHRDKLTELLWPGCDMVSGAKNFKTTLSRLRKSFYSSECSNPVITQGEAIRLNFEHMDADCSRFRNEAILGLKLMSRGDMKGAKEHLEAAQDVYLGDFLPEEPFDQFISVARRELAELHFSVLNALEKVYGSQEKPDALEALLTLRKVPLVQSL